MERIELPIVALRLVSQSGGRFDYDPVPVFSRLVHESRPDITPVAMQSLLDKALELELAALEEDDRGLVPAGEAISNVGGFHSTQNLFDDDQCAACMGLAALRDAVFDAVGAAEQQAFDKNQKPEAWANVNRAGDYNLMHDHEGASWAGVFYADAGPGREDRVSGALVLAQRQQRDPKEDILTYLGAAPQTGWLLLFPGWLSHAVLPFEPGAEHANATRVSFSFNIFTVKTRGKKRDAEGDAAVQ